MKKLLNNIKSNLVEYYAILVIFVGLPFATNLFWGWKIAYATFILVQIPVLILAIKNRSGK